MFVCSDPVSTAGPFLELKRLEASLIAHRNVHFNFKSDTADHDKSKITPTVEMSCYSSFKSAKSKSRVVKDQNTHRDGDYRECLNKGEMKTREGLQKQERESGGLREKGTICGNEKMQTEGGESDTESDSDREEEGGGGGRAETGAEDKEGEREGEGGAEWGVIEDVGVPKMTPAPREFLGFSPLGPDHYTSLADPCLQVRERERETVTIRRSGRKGDDEWL